MIEACPGPGGGAPMIRMPDALEANIQKATDLGVLGLIIPTVDDALEARDAARFSRYPPFGRRSSGGGAAGTVWSKVAGGYRNTINDNFLVVVMLETLEGITNADEIASTFGLDVVIQGNGDLQQFSGWTTEDERYQALLTISHNAALKAGKFWGNAGATYLTGNPLSPDTRFVQNGPSYDGFSFPAWPGRRSRRRLLEGRGRGSSVRITTESSHLIRHQIHDDACDHPQIRSGTSISPAHASHTVPGSPGQGRDRHGQMTIARITCEMRIAK